jgi:hypothetical protein
VPRRPSFVVDECEDEIGMNAPLIDSVAVTAAVVVAILSIFQILLVAGLPFGHAAFGGENKVLSRKLRYVSALSVFIFIAAIYIVLARGGLLGGADKSSSLTRVGIWVLVAMFGVSTLANFMSRSNWERLLMAPIALILVACCVTLALS